MRAKTRERFFGAVVLLTTAMFGWAHGGGPLPAPFAGVLGVANYTWVSGLASNTIVSYNDNNLVLKGAAGKEVVIQDDGGSQLLITDRSNGAIETSHVLPVSDNAYSLGSTSLRWVYARVASGIYWLHGTGSVDSTDIYVKRDSSAVLGVRLGDDSGYADLKARDLKATRALNLNASDGTSGQVATSGGAGASATWTDVASISTATNTVSWATDDFRLTLVDSAPVGSATNAGTLYLCPVTATTSWGSANPTQQTGKIAVQSPSGTLKVMESKQVSLSITATSGNLYDVFGYDSSGTLTLETLIWSTSGAGNSSRATAIVQDHGAWFKSGDLTRRYLGTFYATATNATSDDTGSGGRCLWNAHNRRPREQWTGETSASWTYNGGGGSGGTWRARNNNTTVGTERLQFVIGLVVDEEIPEGEVQSEAGAASGSACAVAIQFDGTTGQPSNPPFGGQNGLNANGPVVLRGKIAKQVGPAGFHYAQAIEVTDGVTVTFFGRASANSVPVYDGQMHLITRG